MSTSDIAVSVRGLSKAYTIADKQERHFHPMHKGQFRRAVRRLVNGCGLDVRRYPVHHDPDHIRRRLLLSLGIAVVLDVGANEGQYGELIRHHGYKGRIISFEPVGDAFGRLNAKCHRSDGMWAARREALGAAEGTIDINVAGTMSSVLPQSKSASDAVAFSFERSEKVPLRRLDNVWNEMHLRGNPVWLKIDVQGYEGAVLEGTASAIGEIVATEIELSLWPFYEGQVLYRQMLDRLDALGFDLWSVTPGSRDSTGRMVEMDAIFVNRNIDIA